MARKVKMTLLTETLHVPGGVERFVSTFLQHVSSHIAVELTVFHEGQSFYSLPSGIPVFVLNSQPLPPSEKLVVDIPLSLLGECESFVWLELLSSRLTHHLVQRQIDCVLTTNFLTSLVAYKASLRHKVKVIARLASHLSNTLMQNPAHREFRMFWAPRLRELNPIVCISQGIADDLTTKWGIPHNHLHVIYNPLDVRKIQDLSQEPVTHPWFAAQVPIFLFVGRLVKFKGVDILLNALKIANSEKPARLLVVGEGEEKGALQELAKALHVEDKVDFIGATPNPFSYMSKVTALVLPSLVEGLANVILEALTCGCPVISTDCLSGPAEILQGGQYGVLVPPADEEALAAAMLKLLQDHELRTKLAELGPQRAKDFDAPKIVKQYEQLIMEVV